MGRTPIPGVPNPSDWAQQQCNRAFLKAHPICAVRGCGRKARHADHIQTVRSAPHLRFDWNNLQPLCHAHHSRLTAAYDSGTIRGACDADGNPLDPSHPWAQSDNASAIDAANRKPSVDPLLAARLKRRFVIDRKEQ